MKFILLILILGALGAHAYETRQWETIDGTRYYGRFLREMFNKVTIEDDQGIRHVLRLKELSDLDKKYLRVMVPPEIETEVDTSTVRLETPKQFYYRLCNTDRNTVTAQIKKKSQRPFTSRLKGEVFVIGEEVHGDLFILLSYTAHDFLLPGKKDATTKFRSEPTQTEFFEDFFTGKPKGELYKGHLLIITSLQGEQILVDSDLPSWMQTPEMIENLRQLATRGAASVRSRHFDKTGQKVMPTRPKRQALMFR